MSGPLPHRPLFVSHTAAPGGSNEVVLALLAYRPAGSEPSCVFLSDGPMLARVERLGVASSVIDAGRSRDLWKVPGAIASLRREIRARPADLVFAHVPKAHAYASIAAAREHVPYLWWQHDPPQLSPGVKKIASKLPAKVVICSSEFSAMRQRALGGKTPVVRIYPGIDPAVAHEPRAHVARATALVGSIARLQRYKRHELLLRAARLVLDAEPGTRFRVIGEATPGVDPEYPAELREETHALGIERSVEFTGHLDDVPAALRELDVLVHTARSEPFGLVLIEAMLHGVPVICPPEGGPAEIVRDGIDGFVLDVDDEAQLAAAIVRLIQDPALRQLMGRAGRERVLDCFTAQEMARQTWRLLEQVATRKPPG
jgi:glycosyltransferase involved in cell wall biosynthesis